MLKIIQNNPYRFLGVCSNAPVRERLANINRLKAFLKVGRPVSFPMDMNGSLPPITRTVEGLDQANNSINLPQDQLKYALFWFANSNPIDKMALEYLQKGNKAKALELWGKKDNFSSLLNRATLAFADGDEGGAIGHVTRVVHDGSYRKALLEAIGGSTFQMQEDEMAQLLVETLLEEMPAQRLSGLFAQHSAAADYTTLLKSKTVGQSITAINTAIAAAKNTEKGNADAQLRAGQKLMDSTKAELQTVRSTLGASDMQYQMVADNLARQILQCGINYYNHTSEDDDVSIDKAMTLQEYALNIAVGKLTRDRCQENVDILKEKKKRLPPPAVKEEVKAILNQLSIFCKLPDKIEHSLTLLSKAKEHLQSMRRKLGKTDEYYLRISSLVVNNALHNLIEEVNATQNRPIVTASDIFAIKYVVDQAWMATLIMDDFDKDAPTQERYSTNRATLQKLHSQLASTGSSSSSSSDGCYIATMVYGYYDHPQVMVLRHFRDHVLRKTALGRAFIRFYYKHSPSWVEKMQDKKTVNDIIRHILDLFITFYRK